MAKFSKLWLKLNVKSHVKGQFSPVKCSQLMSRSTKKGPHIDPKLLKKVKMMTASGQKQPIKTWARSSQIPPDFVGHTFLVHNGRKFLEVFISEDMVGHLLGEFSHTRTFRGHGKVVKRTMDKT